MALQHAWARRIAELFVQATRYDPQHSADAEQALYSRLPGWLESLRSEELIEISLGPKGQEHRVELTRPDLVVAAEPFYERFLEQVLGLKRAENVTLLLAHSLAELPGLEPRLADLRGAVTVPLPAGAAAAGALLTAEQIRDAGDPPSDPSSATSALIRGDGLPFVTRLTFEAPPAAAERPRGAGTRSPKPAPHPTTPCPAAPCPNAPCCPTHLVYRSIAYPITERPFRLGLASGGELGLELEGHTAGTFRPLCSVLRRDATVVVEDHGTRGSFVNGERINGRAILEVGDRLRLGPEPSAAPCPASSGGTDIEIELIAVVDTGRLHPTGVRLGAPPGRRST